MLIALKETLKHKGYDIAVAGSAVEAVGKLKAHAFDLVISDVRMPVMSGLDLLHQVKSMAPETDVVLLTGFGTVQSAVEAMKSGAFDYLLKPFSSDDLAAVVR